MARALSITEARDQIAQLPEVFAADPELDAVTITRRGEPVMAVLPWALYESIRETLEILADPDLTAQLKSSIEQIQAGDTVPWDEAKTELAL